MKNFLRRQATVGILALGAAFAASSAFAEQTLYPVGRVECAASSSQGFILTQKQGLRCTFYRNDGNVSQYMGTIGQFGLEAGNSSPSVITWQVSSTVPQPAIGALSGTYQTAGISSGSGPASTGGIVGGVDNSIVLRPTGSAGGSDFAAGVTTITLSYIASPQ